MSDKSPNALGSSSALPGDPLELTLDAAVERMMLEAQIVAHGQAHQRAEFRRSERARELGALIDQIANQIAERSQSALRLIGVLMEHDRGELRFLSHGATLTVRPGPLGRIVIGAEAVLPPETFYTEELYRQVMTRVTRWALSVEGDRLSHF